MIRRQDKEGAGFLWGLQRVLQSATPLCIATCKGVAGHVHKSALFQKLKALGKLLLSHVFCRIGLGSGLEGHVSLESNVRQWASHGACLHASAPRSHVGPGGHGVVISCAQQQILLADEGSMHVPVLLSPSW